MTRLLCTAGRPATMLSGSRKHLSTGLLALVLAFPGTARPWSLEELLRLPLECLLQLEVSPRPVSQASSHGVSAPGRLLADGGRHAV